MNADTATATARTSPPDLGNNINHVYCCDPNLALCGTDLTHVPEGWTPNTPTCAVCEALEGGPCPACK